MSMAENGPKTPYERDRAWRKERGSKISLEPTTDKDRHVLREPVPGDPIGAHADRFPGLYPQEIEQETRTVRLDISFGDPLKIRDQAEMISAAMAVIIGKTREHALGSIRQRIETRREADSLRRALARFNGKQPHGDTYKKR